MKFLNRFWTILIGCFHRKKVPPTQVTEQEILARFITSSKWFSRKKSIVKPQAFMPPPNLKVSVFRITSLSDTNIWEIGHKQVIDKMKEPKSLYGRANIKALSILNTNLQIEPDNKPKGHANITSWPELKEEQKSIAQELAAASSLHLRSVKT